MYIYLYIHKNTSSMCMFTHMCLRDFACPGKRQQCQGNKSHAPESMGSILPHSLRMFTTVHGTTWEHPMTTSVNASNCSHENATDIKPCPAMCLCYRCNVHLMWMKITVSFITYAHHDSGHFRADLICTDLDQVFYPVVLLLLTIVGSLAPSTICRNRWPRSSRIWWRISPLNRAQIWILMLGINHPVDGRNPAITSWGW